MKAHIVIKIEEDRTPFTEIHSRGIGRPEILMLLGELEIVKQTLITAALNTKAINFDILHYAESEEEK